MGQLKWVTNAQEEVNETTVICLFGQSRAEAVQKERRRRRGLLALNAKATEKHSSLELSGMGLIGLYRLEQ